MHFIHLAQDPTAIPDAAVVEVVEQATKAIDTFNNLGVFMAVLGVFAFFALAILILVWSNRNTSNTAVTTQAQVIVDKARENQELKDERREDKLRQQQYQEQFLAMLAVLAGKQTDISTGLTSSEARLTSQITTSESTIKGRVQTVGDANIARLDKIDKALAVIQTAINAYSDPDAEAKYDRALTILTAKLEAVKDDLAGVKTDTAANTDARVTSEMAAIEVMPAADAGTVATEGGESEDRKIA